jgi:hypothetical protein
MKITAIIPETLIEEVKKYSGGQTITDSLKIALTEWVDLKHVEDLNAAVAEKPLEFAPGITAGRLRRLNRK